ncbi:Organic solvent tolerance protein [Luteitalea pratensis]|uniref:Organic solvent tolerance protein n=1 Tax=Luteitalea pratensis TaxID=1855912 RepID=A0A143PV57_LUTPR|nr:putative LPS assembly protein LptD [Luteitalea pratensis]AMY12575.1 Organic solvent tolerance protein [Luteitalea pratensis]
MHSFLTLRVLTLLFALSVVPCAAIAQQVPGFKLSRQLKIEIEGSKFHFLGEVEMTDDGGKQKFFADRVDYDTETRLMVATGNVVYTSPQTRIAAEKLEFDLDTKVGTFYNATGSSYLGDKVDKSFFGTQEADALFYGEVIEKVGPKRYKITHGGFTSCVQPTPRWELVSSTSTVELDEYALLKNTVLKVKGVPMFYLPVMYYPIQADDRATGFLLPTYGSSIVRGPSISNAFFWAINRSQDATVYHDWFTKRGQGLGAEYRYVAGTGSQGNFTTYYLKEKEATYTSSSGTVTTPAATNYEVRANVAQVLPLNLRARGNVDYFSSIVTRSTFNQNPYDWSSRTRSMRGNLSGNWGRQSVSASYDTTELFYSETASSLQGGTPRLAYSLAQSRIGETPLYYSFNSEYVSMARLDTDGDREIDQGLNRFDVNPTLRVPFNKLPYLTFNSSVSYHYTRYSESYVKDLTNRDVQAEVPLTRSYWDLRTDIVGPKFTKVWDTPDNGYAEKFKHTIEPTFTVQRLTAFDDFDRIVKLEGYDFTYGGTTRIAYGIVNRFTAKRRSGASSARTKDFLTIGVTQSYYSDPQASLYDFGAYPLNYYGRAPSKFSPIALGATLALAEKTSISTRLDWDDRAGEFQSIRLNGSYALREWLDVNGGWSQRKISFFPDRPDKFFNASTNFKTKTNRFGGTYAFYYDLGRKVMMDQRIVGYYNAQCCGVVVEYQQYNYPQYSTYAVPQDHRFNIGFTLAGLGTFSNFLGAFGGNTGQSGGFGSRSF